MTQVVCPCGARAEVTRNSRGWTKQLGIPFVMNCAERAENGSVPSHCDRLSKIVASVLDQAR
jgi:hypothetical protein